MSRRHIPVRRQTTPLSSLSLELIDHILSYLDYVDLDVACMSVALFYRYRPFVVVPRIANETDWTHETEGSQEIPRQRLRAHNSFLRLVCRTFTIMKPTPRELDLLVSLFVQELRNLWVYPVGVGGNELFINDSVDDTIVYRRRYPHLLRLARILRWNWAGPVIAERIDAWFHEKWEEMKDEPLIQQWLSPNYELPPPPRTVQLEPHQRQLLRGMEFMALRPINFYAPQGVEAEDLESSLNRRAWRRPGFDRLKVWLSIPELWGLEIRHEELVVVRGAPPWRLYFKIEVRPFLTVVLFSTAEYLWFSLEIFRYLRRVERAAPCPGLVRTSAYWYEEAFLWSVLQHSIANLSLPGQYIVVFKKLFVALIRGYIELYGPMNISDLMNNLVYFVHDKQLPIRTIVARVVMSELLMYGYDFLTPQAKSAIVGLITDGEGRILRRESRIELPDPFRRPRTPPSSGTENHG
jgi:hypothetical protein